MIRVPILAAALAAVLCLTGGGASAQDWRRHGPQADQRPAGFPQAREPESGGGRRGEQGFGPFRGPPPTEAPPLYAPPPAGRPPPPTRGWPQNEAGRPGQRQAPANDPDRIIGNVGQRFPGHLLNFDNGYIGGRPVYRVQWLTAHGNVIYIFVDAGSGRILSER